MGGFEVLGIDRVPEDDSDVLVNGFRGAVPETRNQGVDLGIVVVDLRLPFPALLAVGRLRTLQRRDAGCFLL